jgi:hypothetical protein
MHFTASHLMVLSDEGTYRLYDLSNPSQYAQYTLGADVADLGVISAKAHNDGFVVLTGGLQFLEVRGWKGGRVSALAAAGRSSRLPLRASLIRMIELKEAPHAWTLLPPDQSMSGHVEVLVSTGTTIITLDALERIDQVCHPPALWVAIADVYISGYHAAHSATSCSPPTDVSSLSSPSLACCGSSQPTFHATSPK